MPLIHLSQEREVHREPQNSSLPVPRFQRSAGVLDHTGGTYSHNGKIDLPRILVTEWNLGNFPDSMEFRSWKVNFETEVCSKAADRHFTMQWLKGVEIESQLTN